MQIFWTFWTKKLTALTGITSTKKENVPFRLSHKTQCPMKIYMAKQGIAVTAYDLCAAAIENAKNIMTDAGIHVNFVCKDVIKSNITDKVDLVYDSGMFHHLAPHRRITYIELLKKILNTDGYFGLT